MFFIWLVIALSYGGYYYCHCVFISSLEKKEIDKIQKWRIFVTFLILTFKLYESITKQIKTCPNRQVWKLCLRGLDFARSAQSAGCAQICSYSNCAGLVLIYKFWTGNCVAMVQTNKPHNTMFNKKYATGAYFLLKLVAGVGFEPTTFRLWAWRATGLLYPAIRCVYYILFVIIVK